MRILIAVDENGFAETIDKWIDEYHLKASDFYKVVHVVPRPVGIAEYLKTHSGVAEQIYRDSLSHARSLVRKTALKLRSRFHNTHVSEQICEGDTAPTINKIASLWPADLIVVGCHGRDQLDRLLLGSVSSEVIATAPCTTMVLRQPTCHRQEKDLLISTARSSF